MSQLRIYNTLSARIGRKIKLSLLASVAVGATSTVAHAQAVAKADADSTVASAPASIQEVVVTASKRSETLSKAPLAISALSGAQLQEAGINSVKNLTSEIPGVQILASGLVNYVGISIRGISDGNPNQTGNPAVSTYVDGIYVGALEGLVAGFYDLDRLEVLRGPQGTLYGRNATGGNLNIITADPTPNFGAQADVSYGSFDEVQAHATVNLPVTDDLALRASVMMDRSDGAFKTQDTLSTNYGAADNYGGRLTALWKPLSTFRWRLSVEDDVVGGTTGPAIETNVNGQPANGLPVLDQPTTGFPEPYNRVENASVRSRMDWDITKNLVLTYIAGYQNVRSRNDFEIEGQPLGAGTLYDQERIEHFSSYSNEVDLIYSSSRLDNTFGASIYRQDLTEIAGLHEYSYATDFGEAPEVSDNS